MITVLSREHTRIVDKRECEKRGSTTLIYEAALGIYKAYDFKGKVGIVCGKGNNGGDGLALALILHEHEIDVEVILLYEEISKDADYYLTKIKERGIKYQYYDSSFNFSYDLIVDGILGIGFRGELDTYLKEVVDKINNSDCKVISIDINSGLDANNGLGYCVKSDLTVATGCYKYGHFLNDAKDVMKEVKLAECGFELDEDAQLIEKKDLKEIFNCRLHNSNKGTYGSVGIMGSCKNYPGAIKLANLGMNALYAGCGISRMIIPDAIASFIYKNTLETTVCPLKSLNGSFVFDEDELKKATKGLKAIGFGVGIGQNEEIKKILEYLLLNFEGTLIIDADGLNNLAKMNLEILNQAKAKVVLTPHPMEFSRLTKKDIKEILHDPIKEAKDFVNKYNVTLLLKGVTTVIASKHVLYLSDSGTAGMASAGSGDVLLGIITGMLGYNQVNLTKCVAYAAYLNGLAGMKASERYGDIGMVASDTARSTSLVIKEIADL